MSPARLPTLAAALLGLSTCFVSGTAADPPGAAAVVDRAQPPATNGDAVSAHLNYDQLTAMIPARQAALGTVVTAQIHIALHKARRRAQRVLCAGEWTPAGVLLREDGPRLVRHPLQVSPDRFWLYRSFRQPGPLSCGEVTRAHFFMEISRHLPDWLTIRPAGQRVAYQQGRRVLASQQAHLAAR